MSRQYNIKVRYSSYILLLFLVALLSLLYSYKYDGVGNILMEHSNNNNTSDVAYTNIFNSSLSKFKFFIFQIGFMKAGTTSLEHYFKENGISTIHFKDPEETQSLSQRMFANYISNKYILQQYYNRFMYYGDFDVYIHNKPHYSDILFLNKSYKFGEYRTWFDILTKEYPNSKYILNIRNVNHWLKSQYTYSGKPKKFGFPVQHIKHRYNDIYHTDIDVIKGWRSLWYQYICQLLDYFDKNNIVHNLVLFDIERDSHFKLISFFRKHNLTLNESISMFNSRKTNKKRKWNKLVQVQFAKWDNITVNYPEFKSNNNSEYHQIAKICHSNIPFSH